MSYRRWLVDGCSWLLCLFSACATDDVEYGDRAGVALVSIASVPVDVACLRIAVTGTVRIERSFEVSDGPQAFLLEHLPLGALSFRGDAYSGSCRSIDAASKPSWESEVVDATLVAGIVADVHLVMRRTGQANITVEFDGDAVDSSYQDAGSTDAASPDGAISDGATPDAATPADAASTPDAWTQDTGLDEACGRTDVSGNVLLDVGHTSSDTLTMSASPTRLVVVDGAGHWVLWDASSHRQLASGDGAASQDMRNSLFVIFGRSGTVDVRDVHDGHLLNSFVSSTPFLTRHTFSSFHTYRGSGLSEQGDYLWGQSQTGLRAWSLDGALLVEIPGDYSRALVFPAAGELRVGGSPSNPQRIERISLESGSKTTSREFAGTFKQWYEDGERFISARTTELTLFTADATPLRILSAPRTRQVGGYGRYAWWQSEGMLHINSVDTGEVVLSVENVYGEFFVDGGRLAIREVSKLVDLRAGTVVVHTEQSVSQLSGFVANPHEAGYTFSSKSGLIHTVEAPGVTPSAAFGCGSPTAIAASAVGRAAVATADGYVRFFELEQSSFRQIGRLPLEASELQISADGTTLAAWAPPIVRTLSVPSAELLHEWRDSTIMNMSLAREAPRIALVMCVTSSTASTKNCQIQVMNTTGEPAWPPIVLEEEPIATRTPMVLLSPNGARLAVPAAKLEGSAVEYVKPESRIYENGILLTTLERRVVGWFDDSRLFTHRYTQAGNSYRYTDTVLSDLQGQAVSANAFKVDLEYSLQTADATHVYSPRNDVLYSLLDGSVSWSSPHASLRGAVTAMHVVHCPVPHLVSFASWQ